MRPLLKFQLILGNFRTPTVKGVSPGERLIRVDNLETKNATWGAIYNAMHDKPGETRMLVLERGGNRLTVTAKVTAFWTRRP